MVDQELARPTVGSRIREKRQEKGISIRELARRTGFTASFISQVENEKANVSLDSLRRIATALDVQILYFFPEFGEMTASLDKEGALPQAEQRIEANKPYDTINPVIKGNMRPRLFLPDPGITYELLTNRHNHKMEAFIGRITPGTENVASRLSIPTEEFIFCMEGSLKIGLLDQVFTLEAGDSIHFNGQDLTCLASGSQTEESVWLSVITPPAF